MINEQNRIEMGGSGANERGRRSVHKKGVDRWHKCWWGTCPVDPQLQMDEIGRWAFFVQGKVRQCWQDCFYTSLTLFESRYTLKGRYSIGNVGKTASMRMLTLFESIYTLKGRYIIGNVGKTASMRMLTLFELRYTLKGRYSIGNVGKTASMRMLTLFESRYTLNNQPVTVSACYVVSFMKKANIKY